MQQSWPEIRNKLMVYFFQSDNDVEEESKVEGRGSRTPSESSEKGERPQSRDGQKYPQVCTHPYKPKVFRAIWICAMTSCVFKF